MTIDTDDKRRADEIIRKLQWALTEDETDEVREGLRILRAFKSFGMIGSWVKGVVIWLAIIIGGWLAFNEWVIKFIKGAAGPP